MTNMLSERTPLAVLASALSEQSSSPAPEKISNSADWWASKKRKRTVACGRCDACCRRYARWSRSTPRDGRLYRFHTRSLQESLGEMTSQHQRQALSRRAEKLNS